MNSRPVDNVSALDHTFLRPARDLWIVRRSSCVGHGGSIIRVWLAARQCTSRAAHSLIPVLATNSLKVEGNLEISRRRRNRVLDGDGEGLPRLFAACGGVCLQDGEGGGSTRCCARRRRPGRPRDAGQKGQGSHGDFRIAPGTGCARPARHATQEALRLRRDGSRWLDRNPG